MAWNAASNTWSAPGTSFDAPEWNDIYNKLKQKYSNWDSMTGQQKTNAFQTWWSNEGSQNWTNAWQEARQPWQDLYNDWLEDQGGTKWGGEQPETPDLGAVDQWAQEQLYGAGDSNGIMDMLSQLAGEASGGGEQYRGDWMNEYASQAGFDTPEARETWLAEQRANQTDLQGIVQGYAENPTQITPEQQKLIREQQRTMEEAARKQAIASYQETGSYATLQRASDELNKASVDQALKSQMEMANQNFATALAAANQQTEMLMREVEAGEQSFMYYVQAKQQGVQTALAAWQAQADVVMAQAEQKMYAMQTEFGNEQGQYEQAYQEWQDAKAALDRQGDLIMAASAEAMGGSTDMLAEMNEWYSAIMQPMIDQWEGEIEAEASEGDRKRAGGNIAGGILLIGLGIIVGIATGWTGIGAGAGAGLVGLGGTMFSTGLGAAATPK